MNKRVFITLILLSLAATASGAGFTESYTVAHGDLNGDTKKDLFIKAPRKIVPVIFDDQIIPIPVAGDVPDFVLLNTGSRTFTIAPALTASQLATARQWPIADLDLSFRDVNQDGFLDMEIDGMTPLVTQAFDQIVYAPSLRNQLPTRLAAKNLKFQHYHEQVFGWLRDHEYFEKNAPWKIVATTEPAQRAWYASIGDAANVTLMSQFVADCQVYVGNTGRCAISTTLPPGDCNRSANLYDSAGNYVGSGTFYICDKPIHVVIYLPGIQVVKDYSRYDEDAKETVEILIRLSASCPAFNGGDEQALGSIEERIYQSVVLAGAFYADAMNSESHAPFPGDSLFDPSDKTFHHYDVRTKICKLSEANCTIPIVRDIAHRNFSMPHFKLAPMFTNIPGPHQTAYVAPAGLSSFTSWYTIAAGFVTQQMVVNGTWATAIQNITEAGHISYPGTISRYVELKDDALQVFTHGIGVNRSYCALNQASRPAQILIATANDLEGPKQFGRLSKQMRNWWQQHYSPLTPPPYVPYDYTPASPPPTSESNIKTGTPPNY